MITKEALNAMTVLVKAAPDERYYLEWSTQSDSPAWVYDGYRDVLRSLILDARFRNMPRGHAHVYMTHGIPDEDMNAILERIDRADETGSSYRGPLYGWNHEEFVYRGNQVPPPPVNQLWVLPRKFLSTYCHLTVLESPDEDFLPLFSLRDTSG